MVETCCGIKRSHRMEISPGYRCPTKQTRSQNDQRRLASRLRGLALEPDSTRMEDLIATRRRGSMSSSRRRLAGSVRIIPPLVHHFSIGTRSRNARELAASVLRAIRARGEEEGRDGGKSDQREQGGKGEDRVCSGESGRSRRKEGEDRAR